MIFELKTEYIELCTLLKLCNLVQSGGQAKFVITEGFVKLNNEIETRKKKKIYAGDHVEFEGEKILIGIL